MNLLLISEHYYPKVGGTVSYVENTAINLAKNGLKVFLLIPSIGKLNEIVLEKHPQENLTLLKLGVSANLALQFDSNERYLLCNWVKNNLTQLSLNHNCSIVHLLFGLFIAEVINTKELKKNGIKTLHTIHNIPPFECSNSWKGDKTINYLKDNIRKIGVKWINKKRIKKNPFDYYITPSELVKKELSKYIPSDKIIVIGHGGAEYILNPVKETSYNQINLLTVGGIVPHKNQHLIPEIAKYLKINGVNFIWNIIGPIRNNRYYDYIQNLIRSNELNEHVKLHHNLSDNELEQYYTNASMYIQLSSEEGFCMTVLDAIAYGLPVLATPAGAIPEMIEKGGGELIENEINTLKKIIFHYIKIIDSFVIDKQQLINFKETYTWSSTTDQLIKLYHG